MSIRLSRLAAGLVLGLLVAGPRSADAAMTYAEFSFVSQAGDPIGRGQTQDYVYTAANSYYFSAKVFKTTNGQASYLQFVLGGVSAGNPPVANLDFATNQLGSAFQVGTYGAPGNTAQRAAFAAAGHAGLDVGFDGLAPNTVTGNFTVNSVSFFVDATNTIQIGNLDVTFEQHSDGITPALLGHFVYVNGASPAAVPEPASITLCSLAGLVALAGARRRGRPLVH